MPSLEEILRKTKSKSEQIKVVRKPPSIATDDRPYSIAEIKPVEPLQIEQNPKLDPSLTENKVGTKWEQTENKVGTNREQTRNKVGTNKPIQNRNWEQSGYTTGNTIGNKVGTKREQSGNKLGTKITFSELVGLQRDIILFICHECKNSRSRITESLTLEYMAKSLKRSAGAVKTTIKRLEKKGCLVRVEFKNGRGGWSRYELPDGIYHDALRIETGNKVGTNREQSGNKVGTQLGTELGTSASSSSSSLALQETTTTKLSEEWNFDLTPYQRFGFSKTQLKQLASLSVISAAEVEESLIEFSHDLDNNALPPIKTGKINFLMGLLRSGHSYVSEGFKNEQEAAISEMAKRAAVKRENLLKAKFEAWEAGMRDEERKAIEDKLPTHLMAFHRTYGISNAEVRGWFFDYFIQNFEG